jgi:hypothetical protein
LTSNKNLCINPIPNVAKIDLEQYLAEYYVKQQYLINVNIKSTAGLKELTRAQELVRIDLTSLDKLDNLELSNCVDMEISESGRADYILYWYELVGSSEENSLPAFSPYENLFKRNETNISNQMVAFSLFSKDSPQTNNNNIMAVHKDGRFKFEFLFKNEMFYAKKFQAIK